MDDWDVVELPIDGTLDLHTFAPGEAASVVRDYVDACGDKGILELRIIHGKGRGVLRRIVHSVLERHPLVLEFGLDDGSGGGWGATLVRLRR